MLSKNQVLASVHRVYASFIQEWGLTLMSIASLGAVCLPRGRRAFLRKVGDAAPTLCVQFNGEFIGGRRGVVAEFDSLSFGDQLDICMDFEAMCER